MARVTRSSVTKPTRPRPNRGATNIKSFMSCATPLQKQLRSPSTAKTSTLQTPTSALTPDLPIETLRKTLHRISSHPSLTPYRRRVYRTLLSVPSGHWTTYAILSRHLSSSARAIGNAMKTNPFAPDVPCHRVLASDRTIGGYKGDWGNGGSYAVEKTKLLKAEGVSFDQRGRASGEIFDQFTDMADVISN
ncbi:methylated-DNA--protein-cysteine methyltransferase [Myotisia sp. PD_48]|nr:methylated-DNA--protein-cysteine methyltransferase [Myotisia sp. PD_48]